MFAKMAFLNLRFHITRNLLTASAIGISVAMAILLVSISADLNQNNSAAFEKKTDYWVMPKGSSAMDPVTNSENTMLGNVHMRIDEIKSFPGVNSATPILTKVIYAAKDDPRLVLGYGIIPDNISLTENVLTKGDPYYYGENHTHEVTINPCLSKLLGVKKGEYIYLGGSASSLRNSTPFQIMAIVDSPELSSSPVAIMHLSELQELTGNLKGDRANRIIVSGNDLSAKLQSLFPEAMILSEAEYLAHNIFDDKRILATAMAVTIVSFVLSMLFISSAMFISINEKQREFAVMRAIGISDRSIMKIVVYESVLISISGALAGLIIGYTGRYILNFALAHILDTNLNFTINPVITAVVLFSAILSGLVSGVIPAVVGNRASIIEVIGGYEKTSF
jgi:putative ABC transport system permease protein